MLIRTEKDDQATNLFYASYHKYPSTDAITCEKDGCDKTDYDKNGNCKTTIRDYLSCENVYDDSNQICLLKCSTKSD